MSEGGISKSAYAPPIIVRLLCWLGIYLLAQLPLCVAAPWFYAFPAGLAYFYTPSIYPYAPPSFRLYVRVLAISPYIFYLIHFALSMTIPSRRAFRWLMILLIIVVTLNLIGCEKMSF